MRTRYCGTPAGYGTSRPTGPSSPPRRSYIAQALGRSLPRDASDAAGLAPQTGGEEVRHEQAAKARAPADDPEHRPACRPPGEGESAVGTPPDPRRTRKARRDSRALHRLGDTHGLGVASSAQALRCARSPNARASLRPAMTAMATAEVHSRSPVTSSGGISWSSRTVMPAPACTETIPDSTIAAGRASRPRSVTP
jgi:hypothetical protein